MSFLRRILGTEEPEADLRIIITRHGERADLTLGRQWSRLVQRNGRHPAISHLTPRANFEDWNYDTALTSNGVRQCTAVGRKLLSLNYRIDYCYSSPAYRSIQTATKILEGQGQKFIPINIEPGLFECPLWYAGAPLTFIPPEDLARDSYFNINQSYIPIYDGIDETENERYFYERSRSLIDEIIRRHKKKGGTVLLSGHAGSIEALARGVRRRRGGPEELEHHANKVNYCNFAILERDAISGAWTVQMPRSTGDNIVGQQTLASSIPLFSASSQYLLSNHFAPPSVPMYTRPPIDESSRHRLRSRRHLHPHPHHRHRLRYHYQ